MRATTRALAILCLSGCLPGGASVGTAHAEPQYRGFWAVTRDLSPRLLTGGRLLPLYRTLGDRIPPYASALFGAIGSGSLSELLGFAGPGSTGSWEMRNAHPNTLNVLLWALALDGLGREIGALCPGSPQAPDWAAYARADLRGGVAPFCAPGTVPTRVQGWLLWSTLVGPEAPMESFEEWWSFAASSDRLAAPPGERVAEAVVAALFQPEFLFQ